MKSSLNRKEKEEKMILITGGAYQGKSEVAKKIFMEKKKIDFSENKLQREQLYKEGTNKRYQDREQQASRNPIIVEGEIASFQQLQQADIIEHFHLWIRNFIMEEKNPYYVIEELLRKNSEVIVELTQLGCGIVPMEVFDRNYRELVGRIGCYLAEHAQAVYLVNCGLSKRLK